MDNINNLIKNNSELDPTNAFNQNIKDSGMYKMVFIILFFLYNPITLILKFKM